MSPVEPLSVEQLYKRTDPSQFPFDTTSDLPELDEIIGQDRAVDAIEFGIGLRRQGYNIFALGSSGTGKHSVVSDFLTQQAESEPVPSDWCYVYNFKEPHRPLALEMPAGTGVTLRRDMEELVQEVRTVLPTAFETDEYRVRRQAIEATFGERQEEAFSAIQEEAQTHELRLLRTPSGLIFAPVQDGEVMDPEAFQGLPIETQDSLRKSIEEMEKKLQTILLQVPRWERELRRQLETLNEEIAAFAVDPLFAELTENYADHQAVLDYFTAVKEDIIEHFDEFLAEDSDEQNNRPPRPFRRQGPESNLTRYQVNLLVDHSDQSGAPVVYEDNPAYQNLVGRVEYRNVMGGMITDFTLIKSGALHVANDGYLMLDARKLLSEPFAWEGLKRALRAQEIRIETPGQMMSQVSVISLDPEPIPLQVKVALIGDRTTYYMLSQLDPDFDELFKVMADFNDEMDRTDDSQREYAQMLASIAQSHGLRPLDRDAVARVIDQGARIAADGEKLSMRVTAIVDLLIEADYWAAQEDEEIIRRGHVQQALDGQRYRAGRVPERSREAILDGLVNIQTEGAVVGQINGLSVMQLGSISFGRPSRITARVRVGPGEVIDIEREVALGGVLHSKGVLILSSFLGARYADDFPLSLQANLVFEQSYGGVDGDSASSTELYALLSALAEVPISQGLAVTGSVDQFGTVQAIGGVNEKIEGFFAICAERGLTGEQGVLIPQANVRHLMLRQEVLDAVEAGQFHIYAIETIDQGIELLTGVPAGEKQEDGSFPPDTINAKVQNRLREYARQWAAYHNRGEWKENEK